MENNNLNEDEEINLEEKFVRFEFSSIEWGGMTY